MRAVRVGIGILIVLGVVGAGVYGLFRGEDAGENAPIPEPETFISSFTFPDASGNPVALDEIRADVRVINFWASWSPYSRGELNMLAELQRTYGKQIAVIAINRDTNPADGRAFFDSLAIGKDIVAVYDQQDTYYKTVGGYNMPETLIVDEDGGILMHVHGPASREALKQMLDRLVQ